MSRDVTRRTWWWLTTGMAVLALSMRLLPAIFQGTLTGIGSYDEGVYYTAARMVVSGKLPYRDFTLMHTPGIAWLTAPEAWIGAHVGDDVGFALARLFIMGVGVANCLLIMQLSRRYGLLTSVTAGLVYATWSGAVVADRGVFQEPVLSFFILLSLIFIQRAIRLGPDLPAKTMRLFFWVGVAAGAAFSVKIWAIGPSAIVGVFLGLRFGWAGVWRHIVGFACAVAVVTGPAAATAMGNFIHMVFLAQAGRQSQSQALAAGLGDAATYVVVAVLVIGAVGLLVWRGRTHTGGQPGPGHLDGRSDSGAGNTTGLPALYMAIGLVAAAELLYAPIYHDHYAEFVAPWLALTVGMITGMAGRAIATRRSRRAPGSGLARLAVPTVVGILAITLGALTATGRPQWAKPSNGVNTQRLQNIVNAAHPLSCPWSDVAGYLIVSDTLTTAIKGGCPVAVDWFGMGMMNYSGYAYPEAATAKQAAKSPPVQTVLEAQAKNSSVLITHTGSAISSYVAKNPQLGFHSVATEGNLEIWMNGKDLLTR